MSESEQSIFVTDDPPEPRPAATVYVVAANYDGDPHPHIEAVYDNEGAAEAHRRWICDKRPYPHIAWGVHERDVLAGETPLPEREGIDR